MSTPNEIRIVKNRDAWRRHGWTATPNALLLRSDISWDAKGAFGWLSLAADDPEFVVNANSLAAAGPKGRDHARNLVRELEQHGFLTRFRLPDESGVPVLVYELFPLPVPEEERTYRPSSAKPKRKTFSQVMPERLDGQSSDAEQHVVDNSTGGTFSVVEREAEAEDVFAGHARKTGRSGPGRSGPGRSGALTSPSRKTSTSSSLGSSSTVDLGAEQAEEDDEGENSKREELELAARRLAAAIRPHLQLSKKFLMPEVRKEVVEPLLKQRLEEGHREEFLAAQLGRWCREAKNPTTYLPMQLKELGPPRPNLRVVPAAPPETPKQTPESSEEARAQARAYFQANRGRRRPASPAPGEDTPNEPHPAYDASIEISKEILNDPSADQKHA